MTAGLLNPERASRGVTRPLIAKPGEHQQRDQVDADPSSDKEDETDEQDREDERDLKRHEAGLAWRLMSLGRRGATPCAPVAPGRRC